MICLSIFADEYDAALPTLERLGEAVEIVELRLDAADRETIIRAAEAVRRPLILTCRHAEQGGLFSGGEDERLQLLRFAASLRPRFVDVEAGTAAESLFDEFPKQQFILSLHETHGIRNSIEKIAVKLAARPQAIVKIVPSATSWMDNLEILAAAKSLRSCDSRFICFGSGEKGLYSRALASSRGSYITYCSTEGCTPTAKGQFTVDQALNIYRIPQIGRNWKVYGVVGDPVAHSLSPAFHNDLFARRGIEAVYLPFRAAKFEPFFKFVSAAGIEGLSVTAPHKLAAARCSEPGDETTRVTCCANTLVGQGSGYRAYNTDGLAFVGMLKKYFKTAVGLSVSIIGLGGAARAIAFELIRAGAKVSLCGRNGTKGRELAAVLGCAFAFSPGDIAGSDIVVNATTVARPEDDPDGFLERLIPSRGIAIDLHYDPPEPYFLSEAALRGCRTLSGFDMFRRQAALQFERWTGTEP